MTGVVGKDDPVCIVRCQSGMPAVESLGTFSLSLFILCRDGCEVHTMDL